MQTSTLFHNAPTLLGLFALLACKAAPTDEQFTHYLEEPNGEQTETKKMLMAEIIKMSESGYISSFICKYTDKNNSVGRELFLKNKNNNYVLIRIDPRDGFPLQIIGFSFKGENLNLGVHWGGNGAGEVIRGFIRENLRHARWSSLEGEAAIRSLMATEPEDICFPPRI